MDTKKIAIGVGVLIVIVIAIIGFKSMSQPPSATTETTTTATTPPTTDNPSASDSTTAAGQVKEFTVTGSNFKFAPATMAVNKGDKVRIIFNNTGGMHDLVIDEFNAKTKTIQSGATDTIEFTADKAGTFDYYCSVGNHRAMGMVGKITVN